MRRTEASERTRPDRRGFLTNTWLQGLPMMMSPRISIAMATYNGGKYLQEQLDSFRIQSRLPDELVACDDGSSDDTVAILESLRKVAPFEVRVIRNVDNLGYVHNFEKALSLCSGDIIFLSDQDDVWFPEKIDVMSSRMVSEPGLQVLQCDMVLTDENLTPSRYTQLGNLRAAGFRDHMFITGCGTAIRRTWLDVACPIPIGFFGHDNWVHRLALAVQARRLMERPLQYYRRHGQNTAKWALSTPTAVNQFTVLRSHGLHNSIAGWQQEIARIALTAERLEERGEQLRQLGYGGRLPGALVALRAEIDDREKRIAVARQPRLRRIPHVLGLWRRGGYRHFSSWKSAVKDMIRP